MVTKQKQGLFERVRIRLFGLSAEEKAAQALKDAVESQRSPNLAAEAMSFGTILDVPYNYGILVKLSITSQVLRGVHEAILREVTRNGYDISEKYACKCKDCGTEYTVLKEKCTAQGCESTVFTYPSTDQKEAAKVFLDAPNRDNTTPQVNESLLRWILSTDDHWLSWQPANILELRPSTLRVEDAQYMRVVWDREKGTVGNSEYFCPRCTAAFPAKTYHKDEKCSLHPEAELKETAYIYANGSQVEARYARDEMYHGIAHPWLPGFYGISLVISALKTVHSIAAMDDFNDKNYSTGKLAQILVFEGLTPEEATSLAAEVAKQKKLATDNKTPEMLRTYFLGGKGGVDNVDAMPDSSKMQSLDWWRLWREVVSSLYGVTPIFSGVVEQGKSGNNPRMQIDVNNNTTEFYQHKIEDIYNQFVFPRLGVTDYEYKCRPVEEKDEMQDVTILSTKLDVIDKAIRLGFDAELTDEGEVRISGEPMSLEEKNQMQMERLQKQQEAFGGEQGQGQGGKKEDGAFEAKTPFRKENVFNTEKGKAESWIVTKIEEKKVE